MSSSSFRSHCGEIGRHEGLKIPFWRQSTGSTPVGGMEEKHLRSFDFGCFSFAGNLPDSPLAGNDKPKQPRGTVRLPGAAAMYGFFGRAFYFSCAFRAEGPRRFFFVNGSSICPGQAYTHSKLAIPKGRKKLWTSITVQYGSCLRGWHSLWGSFRHQQRHRSMSCDSGQGMAFF